MCIVTHGSVLCRCCMLDTAFGFDAVKRRHDNIDFGRFTANHPFIFGNGQLSRVINPAAEYFDLLRAR